MDRPNFSILTSLLIAAVRVIALFFAFIHFTWLLTVLLDPRAGRSGNWARQLVTPAVRLREGIIAAVLTLSFVALFWFLSPPRLWAWKCRWAQRDAAHLGQPHGPRRWEVIVAWLIPVALMFVFQFKLVRPLDPTITHWIRNRNFVRAVVGIPSHVSFSFGLTDPNSLTTHAIMAAIVWSLILLVVTLTPVRRLPLPVHFVCAFVWTFGGCCLTLAI
ncbi:MAG: hypothetical protein WEC36_08755 [Phycisphaeraceae bacterium]